MTAPHQQLAYLESVGLVRVAQVEPELEYLFRHALVQGAAYDSLLKQDRKRLHLAVGEVLEQLYPDRLASRELAPVLGQHFYEAGDARALKYFTWAGDAAANVYANAEAVAHYSRALEIARTHTHAPLPEAGLDEVSNIQLLHLYTRRGRALELNGRYAEALSNCDEMETVARERGDRALELAALVAHATIHVTPNPTFDVAQGRILLEQALALARELSDPQTEARIYWDLLRLYYWSRDLAHALDYGERSLAIARQLNLREQLAFTLHDLHRSYNAIGQWKRAWAALDEAHYLWRELDNRPMLADALASAADFYHGQGDYEQALTFAKEAFLISQSIGNLWGQSYSQMMMGFIYLECGEVGCAITAMKDAIHLSELAGLVVLEPRLCIQLAWAYGMLGAIEQGREMIRVTLAKTEGILLPNPAIRAGLAAMLARLEILDGNIAAAEDALRAGHAIVDKVLSPGLFTFFGIALAGGELALATQDYARAISIMDDAIANIPEEGMHPAHVDARYLKGQALLGMGQIKAALEALMEARAGAEAAGSRIRLWTILFTLSQLEAKRGDQVAAQALRRQACKIIEYIADHVDRPVPSALPAAAGPDLRASFLSLPRVRAVMEAR